MRIARRESDRQIVTAYLESKQNGPFSCRKCGEPVILKTGRNRINHFAHENPIACKLGEGESDEHRLCKVEIAESLRQHADVRSVAIELPMGKNRPDIFARIGSVQVAIEIQISSLSVETIQRRTIEYGRSGIHVLWLLPWNSDLDQCRYSPSIWEKWIHAAYFGRVYYWLQGLQVAEYRFEPHFRTVPRKSWHAAGGKKVTGGGYSQRSTRFRTPVRCRVLNLATDFEPRQRYWWSGGGITVPDAKLFTAKRETKEP